MSFLIIYLAVAVVSTLAFILGSHLGYQRGYQEGHDDGFEYGYEFGLEEPVRWQPTPDGEAIADDEEYIPAACGPILTAQ